MINKKPYIETIIEISSPYLKETFLNNERLAEFLQSVDFLKNKSNRKEIIDKFTEIYVDFVKKDYQNQYINTNKLLVNFLNKKDDGIKIIWGELS